MYRSSRQTPDMSTFQFFAIGRHSKVVMKMNETHHTIESSPRARSDRLKLRGKIR